MIRIECVREPAKLKSLTCDFDRLSKGATMQRLSWLVPWWEAYQTTHRLHVLVTRRGASVCGIFPLAETHSALTGRSLVFLGSGKVCSDDLGILAESSDSEEVAEAFATWLIQSPDCCRWDQLDLDGVREANQAMAHFGECMEALSGSQIKRKPSPKCWAAPLEGGLVAYRNRLSKRARKIVQEAEAAIDSGKGVLEIAQSQEQALEFVRDIEEMHQARWKERGIHGCFSTSEFTCFLNEAIRCMWHDPWKATTELACVEARDHSVNSRQRVIVARLKIDGAVAAGSICFRNLDTLAMYLVGMNPEFAKVRPGWMLNTCIIKHAIEQGCTKFDFMRGDEDYKERLGGVPSAQHRWLVPSNRVVSQVRKMAYQTAMGVKSWWISAARS
jgi:CelD/BcsL family acetyltransferase involved in cellulose biosynthesis